MVAAEFWVSSLNLCTRLWVGRPAFSLVSSGGWLCHWWIFESFPIQKRLEVYLGSLSTVLSVLRFFLTKEQDSAIILFSCLPGLLMMLSSPVHSRFLKKVTNCWLGNSTIDLFCSFNLMISSFICIDTSLDLSQMSIHSLKSTLLLWSWSNDGTDHTCPWNCHWFKYFWTLGNGDTLHKKAAWLMVRAPIQ